VGSNLNSYSLLLRDVCYSVERAVMMLLILDIMVFSAGVGILLTLTGWKDDSGESLEGKHNEGPQQRKIAKIADA
jgi:hypothetical protein